MQSNPISFGSFKNCKVRYERNGDVDEIFETAKEKMRKLGTKYGIKLYVLGFRLVLNDRFSFVILDLRPVGEE